MYLRILWVSLFTMLMISPLQADWKKATIILEGNSDREYAGKRVVDNELEENGAEPQEGNSKLYAKALIVAEHDSVAEGQVPGTEFKAFGRVRGIAPNDDYNGYYFLSLNAWTDSLNIPETGVKRWEGDHEDEDEERDKDEFDTLTPVASFLSRCNATASITGGDRLHYWSE